MSGLGLIWHRRGNAVDRRELEGVARALRCDGPEAQSVALHGSVGFAYAHRTTTPQDRSLRQPIAAGGGRWQMLFDGRIDHRHDLAAALGLTADHAGSLPDAELAARAWIAWGAEGLTRWYGDFAGMVWDRDRQRLHLFRDAFGRRPLHYFADAGRVVASSMARGIHAVAGIARTIDREKIADLACGLYMHKSQTCFAGIHSVEPGAVVTFTPETSRSTVYYDLAQRIEPVRYASDEEYMEALRDKLRRAIASTTRSSGDVAVSMSGGLDSTSVAVLASAALPGAQTRLPVYTAVPDPDWDGHHEPHVFADERHYARAVAAHCPALKLELIDAAGRGVFDVLERVHTAMETPQRNIMNMIWGDALFARAKSQGAQTLLDGGMGNAGFSYSGADAASQLFRAFDLQASVRQLWEEAGRRPLATMRSTAGLALRELHSIVPPVLRLALLRRRGAAMLPTEKAAVNANYIAEHKVVERAITALAPDIGLMTGRTRDQWLVTLKHHSLATAASAPFGWSALHDLDLRDPLADRQLVEWCLGVPDTQFRRGTESRWLAKRAMHGALPAEVLHKSVDMGRQSADWHLRLTRDLPRIRAEFDRFSRDPELAAMFNFDRLDRHIADWPAQTPTDLSDPHFALRREIPMVLSIGLFVLDNAAGSESGSDPHAGARQQ